jgi:hypothetical protein
MLNPTDAEDLSSLDEAQRTELHLNTLASQHFSSPWSKKRRCCGSSWMLTGTWRRAAEGWVVLGWAASIANMLSIVYFVSSDNHASKNVNLYQRHFNAKEPELLILSFMYFSTPIPILVLVFNAIDTDVLRLVWKQFMAQFFIFIIFWNVLLNVYGGFNAIANPTIWSVSMDFLFAVLVLLPTTVPVILDSVVDLSRYFKLSISILYALLVTVWMVLFGMLGFGDQELFCTNITGSVHRITFGGQVYSSLGTLLGVSIQFLFNAIRGVSDCGSEILCFPVKGVILKNDASTLLVQMTETSGATLNQTYVIRPHQSAVERQASKMLIEIAA